MILSRFVRIQLIIFAILTVIGLVVMGFGYIKLQTFVGIGTYNVKVDLSAAGGLYRFANVTYNGYQVGKVTEVRLTNSGVVATMAIDNGQKIPSDLDAQVRSVSAVGEQYVELLPRTNGGPVLKDGSVIPVSRTSLPQEVGPLLDKVNGVVESIPQKQFSSLLDESFKAFNGAGDDLGSLLDSTNTITDQFNKNADATTTLIKDAGPLLDTQVQGREDIQTWIRSLAGVTGTVAKDDPQVRTILDQGQGFTGQANALLSQIQPTLPILLANLTSVGQVLMTYNSSLETLLVLLPPLIAQTQAVGGRNNPDGLTPADFRLEVNDPPPCTVGFLPTSQRRSPAKLDYPPTPSGLYCKLPQDSEVDVRGARNLPCQDKPGKRAPTVEICKSDQPYVPLAQGQPIVGGNPPDPNLQAQGVPGSNGEPPTENNPPTPTIAGAQYDPNSGTYVGPDGKVYAQTDLAKKPAGARSWTDLMAK